LAYAQPNWRRKMFLINSEIFKESGTKSYGMYFSCVKEEMLKLLIIYGEILQVWSQSQDYSTILLTVQIMASWSLIKLCSAKVFLSYAELTLCEQILPEEWVCDYVVPAGLQFMDWANCDTCTQNPCTEKTAPPRYSEYRYWADSSPGTVNPYTEQTAPHVGISIHVLNRQPPTPLYSEYKHWADSPQIQWIHVQRRQLQCTVNPCTT